MNVSSSIRFLISLLVLWLATSQTHADYMNWSYSTSTVPPGFSVTGDNNGSGSVQITPFGNTAGGNSISAIAFVMSASGPVTFNAQNATYTLTMHITDNTTHDSGNLTFTGSIAGGLSPTSSSLTNTFANPTQSLTLDGHVYTVSLPPSLALVDPTKPQQSLMGTVSVSNGPIAGVPEPATLVLGGLGFSLLGVGGWWKRVRQLAKQDS
jgi:hypothetical protein